MFSKFDEHLVCGCCYLGTDRTITWRSVNCNPFVMSPNSTRLAGTAGAVHRGAGLHRLGRAQGHQTYQAAQHAVRPGRADAAAVRRGAAAARLGHAADHAEDDDITAGRAITTHSRWPHICTCICIFIYNVFVFNCILYNT